MKINISSKLFNKKFLPFVEDDTRYQFYFGGAGSGKSYFCAQKVVLQSFKAHNNILVVRKFANTNRNSTFREIKRIITSWNLQQFFQINQLHITNKESGAQILFSGLDDVQKIKSISGIVII